MVSRCGRPRNAPAAFARVKSSAFLEAEVVWLDPNGVGGFEALHSRSNDGRATAPLLIC